MYGVSVALTADQLFAHVLQPVWVKYSNSTVLSAAPAKPITRSKVKTKNFRIYYLLEYSCDVNYNFI